MNIRTQARRGLAVIALTGMTMATAAVVAPPSAQAVVPGTAIDNVEFRWSINPHSIKSSHAGPNFFSAGLIGNPGASSTLPAAGNGATWANGEPAGWSGQAGNVVVEKKRAEGQYGVASYTDARTVVNGDTTETQVAIKAGSGIVEPATDNATISWDGDFTSIHYAGLAYYTVSDPVLTLVAGDGALTAELVGGSAGRDGGEWTVTSPTTVTLATFTDADVTPWGVQATPDYLGVDNGTATQKDETPENADGWGSFPTSFVEFQDRTGLAAFFQTTSTTSPQLERIASPFSAMAPMPTVTVDKTVVSTKGSTLVTVNGSGFDPAAATGTRPPLKDLAGGAYVVFGKFPEVWRPSAGVSASARSFDAMKWAVPASSMGTIGGTEDGAIELRPDGTFTAQIEVNKSQLDAKATAETLVNYGIYTYPGSGASQAAYETYTPISFITINGSTPTISGAAKVGSTLSARAGTWTPSGTALSYQWNLNGKPIAGATKSTLALAPGHAGGKVTVAVTGTLSGVKETAASAAVTVAKGSFSVAKPKVKGKAKVGKKLTAQVSTPAGSAVTYQWTANGKVIKGAKAKAKAFKLKKAQKGKKIAVKVTVAKAGYTTVVVTSSKTAKVKR